MSISTLLHRRTLHVAVAGCALIAWACNDVGGDADTDAGNDTNLTDDSTVSSAIVLASIADNALAPTFAEFATAAEALEAAATSHAQALRAEEDAEATGDAVREAYSAAMHLWQVAEVMQLGPAAGSGGVGAAFVRDEIYSWPAVNACRIDQELVEQGYADADFIGSRLVNAYGFDALEYLLFAPSAENMCAPQLDINQGPWQALGEDEIAARRAEYAVVVASSLAENGRALADAWAPGGEWNDHFHAPGTSPYGSVGGAMDEVLRAMFYIDKSLKDAKIARPAGILECTGSICLDALESPFAQQSKEQAAANMEGFQRLFFAGVDAESGTGFDDLLEALGETALADEMVADAEAAKVAIEAVEGTFSEALIANEAALDPAQAAVAALTDDLKGDFPVVLMLNIPTEAAGDAD